MRCLKKVPADHAAGKLTLVGFIRRQCACFFAVSKDGNAVAYFQNLRKVMGNQNNAVAFCLEYPKNGKELFDLLRGQHGGRLIQNKKAGVSKQRFKNFYPLLLTYGKLIHPFPQLHI